MQALLTAPLPGRPKGARSGLQSTVADDTAAFLAAAARMPGGE